MVFLIKVSAESAFVFDKKKLFQQMWVSHREMRRKQNLYNTRQHYEYKIFLVVNMKFSEIEC